MTDVKKGNRIGFVLRAFNSRNYRLFFTGQFISLMGTWLTNVATSWLVNRITNDPVNSPRMLGWVNFASLMPAFLLAPFAGVMVDRWRKRRVLVWTQALSMLQSFGLATVAFLMVGVGGAVGTAGGTPPATRVPAILACLIGLAACQGLINAFDMPTRQSLVVRLVERREDLSNGIALNSSMFNLARLIGPAVAGILIWRFGEAWCFTIDGLSYVAVIIALLMMRMNEDDRPKVHRNVLVELREGIAHANGFVPIRDILLVLAMTSFAVTPSTILMPRFATEVLHGDARTQGLLTSAIAVGALLGALRLAARKSVVGLGGQMPWVAVGQGVGADCLWRQPHVMAQLRGAGVGGLGHDDHDGLGQHAPTDACGGPAAGTNHESVHGGGDRHVAPGGAGGRPGGGPCGCDVHGDGGRGTVHTGGDGLCRTGAEVA